MPKICYIKKRFNEESLRIIQTSNEIIDAYSKAGFSLTLRQLYYQFVSRNAFPEKWIDPSTGSTNNTKSYDKLGGIISDARLTGLVDWDAIKDRTRNLRALSHWNDPADIIDTVSRQFRVDLWKGQPHYCEVWVEKDSLVGILETICNHYDVPYLSCRGYTSQSEMWGAAQRLIRHADSGQTTTIIHLGDHDPSGKDMSRDVLERLQLFMEHHGQTPCNVNRIALNMPQVKKYNPPPNPAKITDSRAEKYIEEFGKQSWELDALEPKVIEDLIEEAIKECIEDPGLFHERQEETQEGRDLLSKASETWPKIVNFLNRKRRK